MVSLPTVLWGAGAAALSAASSADLGTGTPYDVITNLTPPIVVGLFVAGVLRTAGEVKRLEAINKALGEDNATLRKVLIEQAVPALTRVAGVMEDIKPILLEVKSALHDLRR